jgi:hypothetical protein
MNGFQILNYSILFRFSINGGLELRRPGLSTKPQGGYYGDEKDSAY